jgi:hypothetical protein
VSWARCFESSCGEMAGSGRDPGRSTSTFPRQDHPQPDAAAPELAQLLEGGTAGEVIPALVCLGLQVLIEAATIEPPSGSWPDSLDGLPAVPSRRRRLWRLASGPGFAAGGGAVDGCRVSPPNPLTSRWL